MINKALLLILLVCSAGTLSADASVWWVFFSDRGPSVDSRLSGKTQELMESRSWERRISVGLLEADELDLDPWEGYVAQVSSMPPCIRIRTISRYLNAVSIEVDSRGIHSIELLPFVSHVQPVSSSNYVRPSFVPCRDADGSVTSSQLEQIALDSLSRRGCKGSGVCVGVLDSGFNLVHEVFRNTEILDMYDFVDDDPDPSQQPDDPPGQADHGTAVLSVMGGYVSGEFCGGAPDATFILAKTEDTGDEYPAEEDFWVQGLEWVEYNGADLVNSSLAYIDWYQYSDLDGNTAVTTVAADAAASRGLAVFNSIGNEGPGDGSLMAPADGDSVFAVGAVDGSGYVTDFSSRGPTYDGRIKPDGCALGQGVVLAYEGTSGYSQGNGTSYSSPLAASVAAALRSAHPEWNMLEIAEIMRHTASQNSSPDNHRGYGILNAYKALLYCSVTGSVRTSAEFEYIPGYPVTLTMGDSVFTIETNQEGWFAFCPGILGSFTVSDGGGGGAVIPVTGILDSSGVEIQVYVDQASDSRMPSVYPNPSRGDMYVGFDLPQGPVDVELTVYTLTGEAVYSSLRRGIGPGTFRAPVPGQAFYWDGSCDDGSPASSGIYIIALRTGDGVELLKFSLVR